MLSIAAMILAANAAQQGLPAPEALIGARSLALSPDGSRLAFSYQGDVWVAPADGGRAIPLTTHIEMDDNPVWSPDGKWIAFASNRTGNWDTFLVSSEGGNTKRLTWWTGSDVPRDWTADGKAIVYAGTREDPANGLYSVNVETGKASRWLLDNMVVGTPRVSPDGTKVLYGRHGFPNVRPRYEGSAAAQIWTYDPATGKRTLVRKNGFQHLWPNWVPAGNAILAVTVGEKTPSSRLLGKAPTSYSDNEEKTPNVYQVELNGKAKRLTNFVGGAGTRFLTVARNALKAAFEVDGKVYTWANGQVKPVSFTASTDDKMATEERLILNSGATAAALSPKGDKMAFVVRSELWMVPMTKGKGPNADDATQLTDWEGLDGEPLWAADNKTLWFTSDRTGNVNLFKLDTETKTVTQLTSFKDDVFGLRMLAVGKELGFLLSGKNGGLYSIPVEGGAAKLLLSRPGNYVFDSNTAFNWSPDGRYLAYSDVLVGSGYYYWEATSNVFVYDTQTKTTVNVTKTGSENAEPAFTPDGKYLLIRSNRDGAGAIYTIPLQPEEARPTELDIKYEKPKEPVKVEIDFTDIEKRARRLVSQPGASDIKFDAETGDIYFLSEGDLWKAAYTGEEVRRLTSGGGIESYDFSADGKQIAATKAGQVVIVEIKQNGTPTRAIGFRVDWTRDLRKERLAAFQQFYRSYNRSFYDGNFHGRDWAGIANRYRPLLSSIGHRNEFATILGMMTGELEASHAEVSPAGPNVPLPNPASAVPGVLFDYSYSGPGIKILSVPNRAPGAFAKTKLNEGEIITEINGKKVNLDEALWRDVLNDQVGREIVVKVKPTSGAEREVKFRALSTGELGGLVTSSLLEWRKKYVEEKSGGKLTYVHIAGMGDGNFTQFNRQVWDAAAGKKGLLIDVRNNGGGNISDRLIDVLERRPHSYYQPRDSNPILAPGQALDFPMAVLHHERSFSNAEMFPYAMRSRKLATLVGMPTPGYVIWTNGLPLLDGTGGRMPNSGVYRLDGTPLENMGQKPDHEVDLSPEDYFAKKDPQLDKAIEVLLKQVG